MPALPLLTAPDRRCRGRGRGSPGPGDCRGRVCGTQLSSATSRYLREWSAARRSRDCSFRPKHPRQSAVRDRSTTPSPCADGSGDEPPPPDTCVPTTVRPKLRISLLCEPLPPRPFSTPRRKLRREREIRLVPYRYRRSRPGNECWGAAVWLPAARSCRLCPAFSDRVRLRPARRPPAAQPHV